MYILVEFLSVVIGRWFLGGIGTFVRRIFQFKKKNRFVKDVPDPLDMQGAYDRFVGLIVVVLFLVLIKLLV